MSTIPTPTTSDLEVHRGQLGPERNDGSSRDNLPNPAAAGPTAYVPGNRPALGDSMDMSNFGLPHP